GLSVGRRLAALVDGHEDDAVEAQHLAPGDRVLDAAAEGERRAAERLHRELEFEEVPLRGARDEVDLRDIPRDDARRSELRDRDDRRVLVDPLEQAATEE